MKLLKAFGSALCVVALIVIVAFLIQMALMWLVSAPAWVSVSVALGVVVLMFTGLFYV